jgi:hypothetical protein
MCPAVVFAWRGPRHRCKGFTEIDSCRLSDDAHQELGSPLMGVWHNMNTHVCAAMTEPIATRDWLMVR